jgi:hypothetical protein
MRHQKQIPLVMWDEDTNHFASLQAVKDDMVDTTYFCFVHAVDGDFIARHKVSFFRHARILAISIGIITT